MSALIETPEPSSPAHDWRPPGWIVGDPDEPYTPEDRTVDGVEIRGVLSLYNEYAAAGYYTSGGTLTEKGSNAVDEQDARDVAHNVALLRDAWNTHPVAWRLAAAVIGRAFVVDPFWNQGCAGMPALVRKLDGISPLDDGMLTIEQAEREMASTEKVLRERYTEAVRIELRSRIAALGAVPPGFPVNWRAMLAAGESPAAANGPHSCTARWLQLCALYGEHEFCAAFVPDNGDGWFQSIGMTAHLVVRLGRVPCEPPPGISIKGGKSSPRGASALCIWVPKHVREELLALVAVPLSKMKPAQHERLNELLPEPTRRVLLTGEAIRVPMWQRPRSGIQYAVVQRANLSGDAVVDFGLMTAAS
jgi:hypothetical protein